MGKIIIGINGIEQNSTHYWFYYVDDKFAEDSVDKHGLYNDSSVFFKLATMDDVGFKYT
jgi:hypothetical protein